jgi:hypothetical protein
MLDNFLIVGGALVFALTSALFWFFAYRVMAEGIDWSRLSGNLMQVLPLRPPDSP